MIKRETTLCRFLNKRLVSFSMDGLLKEFGLYFDVLSLDSQSIVLGVEGFERVTLCVDANAIALGRTLKLTFAHRVSDERFWKCIFAIMCSGNVALLISGTDGPIFSTLGAPEHFQSNMIDPLMPTKYFGSLEPFLEHMKAIGQGF